MAKHDPGTVFFARALLVVAGTMGLTILACTYTWASILALTLVGLLSTAVLGWAVYVVVSEWING